jgi:putative lipoic acid-binding regulatory protein
MSNQKDIESFRNKLEAVTEWPSLYMFKFIVPHDKQQEVKNIFENHEVKTKESSKGNYVSLTIKMLANSSDQIINKYIEAHKVEGIIAL